MLSCSYSARQEAISLQELINSEKHCMFARHMLAMQCFFFFLNKIIDFCENMSYTKINKEFLK